MLAIVVIGILAGGAVVMAIADAVLAPRERERLARLQPDIAVSRAMERMLAARHRFASAVERHEGAVAAERRVLSGSGETLDVGVGGDVTGSDWVETLRQQRATAREEVIDAQRLWESVQPSELPASRVDAWFGSGFQRAWQLGPIGYERFFIRLDHAIDPRCWVIVEVSRPRVGFGFGFERQNLALFSLRANATQLKELLSMSLDGRELSFRPGLVPSRVWRRVRRSPAAKKATTALLRRKRLADLTLDPSRHERQLVSKSFSSELGEDFNQATRFPPGPGLLTIATSGPSFQFGAWTGTRPEPIVRASSGHGVWHR